MILNIPSHDCKNCGECCGVVPVEAKQYKKIKNYVDNQLSEEYRAKLKQQYKPEMTCQFRDEEKEECAIYPVRPKVCRLMGVATGLDCKYGNSANINGYKFLDASQKPKILVGLL